MLRGGVLVKRNKTGKRRENFVGCCRGGLAKTRKRWEKREKHFYRRYRTFTEEPICPQDDNAPSPGPGRARKNPTTTITGKEQFQKKTEQRVSTKRRKQPRYCPLGAKDKGRLKQSHGEKISQEKKNSHNGSSTRGKNRRAMGLSERCLDSSTRQKESRQIAVKKREKKSRAEKKGQAVDKETNSKKNERWEPRTKKRKLAAWGRKCLADKPDPQVLFALTPKATAKHLN